MADIVATVRVDVNHDGLDEVIAKATCSVSGAQVYLVAALQRQSVGHYTTLGVVVDPHTDPVVRNVRDVAVTSAGSVRVEVTNGKNEGPWDPPLLWQWRAYAFSSGRFTQTGGPSTFVADSTVGFQASGSFTVGGTAGGWTDLALAVTVVAKGPDGAAVELVIGSFGNDVRARLGADLGRCGLAGYYVTCQLGPMAPGDVQNLTLSLRVDQSAVQTLSSAQVRVWGARVPAGEAHPAR
jgi:hypothetical protein